MTPADDLSPFRAHGGRIDTARAVFGGGDRARGGWIDLSTGIAPWAYPVAAAVHAIDRLPEPDALAGLEAAAARAFGVADPRRVVAVPGTDLAMRLLAPLIAAARPALVWPGYAGHRAAWPEADPVTADALDHAATRHDLLVLASPANPDGARLDPDRAAALAARTMLLVDQAYADPGQALLPDAEGRLVLLRSFGKFYGLPGLRLGFVLAADPLAARLRAMLGDWPVSAPAIAIGTVAYADMDWCAAQAGRIALMGERLDRILADAGLAMAGHAPLFRLVTTRDATRLFRHLARHAILARPFEGHDDRLRIGLPADEAAVDRLARALQEYAA